MEDWMLLILIGFVIGGSVGLIYGSWATDEWWRQKGS